MNAPGEPEALPVLRVAVLGDDAAIAEFEARVCNGLAWPVWPWHDPDELRFEVSAAYALTTPRHRVMLVIASRETPRTVLAAFDADAVVLASSWQRPFATCGPPKMYGRRVFSRATALLWLGAGARSSYEERTLRGVLRAFGLDRDARAVWCDRDPRGEALAEALDAVTPGRPSELRGRVRGDGGSHFACDACGASLTRGVRRVKTHPAPQTSEEFRHNRHMFPGGGVYALGVDAEAWATRQCGPGDAPYEVALLDHCDLLRAQYETVKPWGGGCCGMIPVGAMNLACRCGARVGYLWSECAMYAVIALRLDRVRYCPAARVA